MQELHQEHIKNYSSSSNQGQRETLGNYLMSFSFHKTMGEGAGGKAAFSFVLCSQLRDV